MKEGTEEKEALLPQDIQRPECAERPADVRITYSDIGQVSSRLKELHRSINKISQSIERFSLLIAEKVDTLCMGNQNDVQMNLEIDAVIRKYRELKRQKSVLEKAAACCRMYGLHGIDYSISADRMYYKGLAVKYFLDPENKKDADEHWKGCYQAEQGEISVIVKRSDNGRILYLKVHENRKQNDI